MGCEHPKLHVLMVFIDFCPENPFKVQTLAEILADKEGGVFISRCPALFLAQVRFKIY